MEASTGFHSNVTAAANFDRTNVQTFTVKHNGHDVTADGVADPAGAGVDDSKSSIKLTATAVVVGRIETVTTTQTPVAGVEQPSTP